jgi:hypothetical protein
MLLHDDIVTNGEPESGPSSGRLGREDGFEHAGSRTTTVTVKYSGSEP